MWFLVLFVVGNLLFIAVGVGSYASDVAVGAKNSRNAKLVICSSSDLANFVKEIEEKLIPLCLEGDLGKSSGVFDMRWSRGTMTAYGSFWIRWNSLAYASGYEAVWCEIMSGLEAPTHGCLFVFSEAS